MTNTVDLLPTYLLQTPWKSVFTRNRMENTEFRIWNR